MREVNPGSRVPEQHPRNGHQQGPTPTPETFKLTAKCITSQVQCGSKNHLDISVHKPQWILVRVLSLVAKISTCPNLMPSRC